jgi:two-component system, OmpR family, sensor histidine kinase TctE
MAPLALTWLAGSVVALGIASFFTQQAFDRSLLDDAYLVATHVKQVDGQLELSLTQREVGTVLFDQVETIFFAIVRPDGTLVAGVPDLPVPAMASEGAAFQFTDLNYGGRPLRAVTLRRDEPAPFRVVMAQTTQSRKSLLERLLVYAVGPQIVLLLLLAFWLRRTIQRAIRPLADLQQAVEQRDANDLTLMPVPGNSREVGRLGAAINSLLGRLDQSARAQREFAGNIAHELRTPLAGIRALAEYGLAQKDPQAWRAQLEGIVSSQARASRLVDQLLALALADEARPGFYLEEIALDDMVRDAVLRFLPRADAAQVDLGARGAENPVRVAGDMTLIEGILNNLIDNALRYGVDTDACGEAGPPSITVALAQEGTRVSLSVIDQGRGMPADMRARLTQRWAQGEAGQSLGQGAGLGLAIVAQYARLMNAHFELGMGAQGNGLTASVYFEAL